MPSAKRGFGNFLTQESLCSMLRGMSVVLHGLCAMKRYNGEHAHVESVQADGHFSLRLDSDGSLLLLPAQNVRQRRTSGSESVDVQVLEFDEGTADAFVQECITAYCRAYQIGPETEVLPVIRPKNTRSSASMSALNKKILIQAAILEHMGKLSTTAKLLGWEMIGPDKHGLFAYIHTVDRHAYPPSWQVFAAHSA